MATLNVEWLNKNEGRAYPVHDRATRKDIDGKELPNDIIVDANIWLPQSLGRYVMISSIGCSTSLFSITFLACFDSPFCNVESVTFKPVAVLTITKPVTRFKTYALTPMIEGVSGWITLGKGAENYSSLFMSFTESKQSVLLDKCVKSYPALPVKDFGKADISPPLQGVIKLHGTPGVVRTFSEEHWVDGYYRKIAMVGLDPAGDKVTALTQYTGPCGHRPSAGNCNSTPITSINGVRPDCNGNIDIDFSQAMILSGTSDGLVIDSELGLAQVCLPDPEVTDSSLICGGGGGSLFIPPTPLGGETSESLSSYSSSLIPGASSTGQYCEDFDSEVLHHLAINKGYFSLARVSREALPDDFVHSNRYISTPGLPFDEQVVLNNFYKPDVFSGYTVKCTISPREQQQEGHVIFGHADPDNFFMAGVILSHPSYPYGALFLAQRVRNGALGGGALGLGNPGSKYLFLAGSVVEIPREKALQLTDYNFTVSVHRIVDSIQVNWSATWLNAGQPQSTTQTYIITPSDGWKSVNNRGLCGFGAYDSVTEFDSFGINCPFEDVPCNENYSLISNLEDIYLKRVLPYCADGGFDWAISEVDGRRVALSSPYSRENLSAFTRPTYNYVGEGKQFKLRTKVRMLSTHAEAHIVYSLHNEYSFSFFGLTRSSITFRGLSYPNGALFYGHYELGATSGVPELFTKDYVIDGVVGPFSTALSDIETNGFYSIHAVISGNASNYDLAVLVEWTTSTATRACAALSLTGLTSEAYPTAIGMGAVNSTTEFTEFCTEGNEGVIDDPGTPPSFSSHHCSLYSSSATPPPIHSPGSSFASSSLAEDFESGGAPELTVISGNVSEVDTLSSINNLRVNGRSIIQNKAYRATNLGAAEAVVIDTGARYKPTRPYELTLHFSPQNGDAFAIFGYNNPEDFYCVGITLSHPSYPDGLLFLAKRGPNGTGGGLGGLGPGGSGYTLISVHPMYGSQAFRNHYYYTIKVKVDRATSHSHVFISMSLLWHDTLSNDLIDKEKTAVLRYGIEWKKENDEGHLGFGTISQNAFFDDFLVNTTEAPPTKYLATFPGGVEAEFAPSAHGAPAPGGYGIASTSNTTMEYWFNYHHVISFNPNSPCGCDFAVDVQEAGSPPSAFITFGDKTYGGVHWLAGFDVSNSKLLIGKTCGFGDASLYGYAREIASTVIPDMDMSGTDFQLYLNIDSTEYSCRYVVVRVILKYKANGGWPRIASLTTQIPRVEARGFIGLSTLNSMTSFKNFAWYPWERDVPLQLCEGNAPHDLSSNGMNYPLQVLDYNTPAMASCTTFDPDIVGYSAWDGKLYLDTTTTYEPTTFYNKEGFYGFATLAVIDPYTWKLTLNGYVGGVVTPYWVGYKIAGTEPMGIYVYDVDSMSACHIDQPMFLEVVRV